MATELFARHYGPLVSNAATTDAVVWLLDGRNATLLFDGVWNGNLTDKVCADPEYATNALIQSCRQPVSSTSNPPVARA